MKRTGPLTRHKRIERKPAATKDRDTEWRWAVYADRQRCQFPHGKETCECWGRLEAHHVILRRHRKTRYCVDNGALLCAAGHAYVHANPEWSRQWGLLARPGTKVVRGRAYPD